MIFHRQPAKSRSRYRTLVYPSPLNPPLCVPTIRCGKSITLETTSGKLRRHVSPCRGSRDSSRWSYVLVVRFVSADGQTLARTIYQRGSRYFEVWFLPLHKSDSRNSIRTSIDLFHLCFLDLIDSTANGQSVFALRKLKEKINWIWHSIFNWLQQPSLVALISSQYWYTISIG